METYADLSGGECVVWTDENGAMHSMTKKAYDEMIAKQAEQSTPIVEGFN
jgi:hypothetical protein